MAVKMKETMGTLSGILGAKSLVGGRAESTSYFTGETAPEGDYVIARPCTTEEVQRVLTYARENNIPVYTLKDSHLPGWIRDCRGIILDITGMKSIEKIDLHGLSVNIAPGVTYNELADELNRYGLKILMPAFATSPYVTRNSVNRVVMQAASRYPELQFSNLAVALPDSRLFKTGGHALTDNYADWKDVLGPHLEKWFHASEEIYGVITRATIWTYKRLEGREAALFSFNDRDKMLGFLKEISRKELCQEAIGLNSAAVSRLLNHEPTEPWYAMVGNESFKEHVEYQTRKISEICETWEGKKTGQEREELLKKMEAPWIIDPACHFGFYALYSRLPELDKLTEERLTTGSNRKNEKEVEKIFVSVSLGRTVYAGYLIPELSEDEYYNAALEAIPKGAFFNRPLGRLAEYYYPKTANYLEMMRKVKKMLDPAGYLNPHQPYRGWIK